MRALYSKNVPNLIFAGRNISVSHVALSSTRVMATCMQLGQAAGTLASVALSSGRSLKETGRNAYAEVQRLLLEDDVTIPGLKRSPLPELLKTTLLSNRPNAECVRNGNNRLQTIDGEELPCWKGGTGDYITYDFGETRAVSHIRLVLDSALEFRGVNNRQLNTSFLQFIDNPRHQSTPREILQNLDILGDDHQRLLQIRDNHQRFLTLKLPEGTRARSITLRPLDPEAKAVLQFEVYMHP